MRNNIHFKDFATYLVSLILLQLYIYKKCDATFDTGIIAI